ncbi:DUF5131 family protein [Chelatococcus reniformis]|uniref:DUF5131 family protein n=1 Tax=Chelatococcus reniformis TaxID=1494448 RepID=A0A916XQE6_9HYPH|nr:DUF5131 family protein [Chelatococcus reniformis]GGC90750.1 hypothetical protein GCM10010994_55690 [Chelatococcus reniformis]
MAETTGISWCDHTHSPWVGCSKVSPACDGCYAEHLMDTRMGRVEWGRPGSGAGTRSRTSAGYWRQLLRWSDDAKRVGRRATVFPSLCDPFDNQVDPAWRREWFDLIRQADGIVMLMLTKRPQNILPLVEVAGGLPRNVALGTTVEDQKRADINVPALVLCGLDPLFFFVSCEPLLGPINLTNIRPPGPGIAGANLLWKTTLRPRIGWVIAGGETDQGTHKARPTHPAWARGLRDQCAAAGVPFHWKQHGEWIGAPDAWNLAEGSSAYDDCAYDLEADAVRVGKKRAGRLLDGVEHNGMPEDAA